MIRTFRYAPGRTRLRKPVVLFFVLLASTSCNGNDLLDTGPPSDTPPIAVATDSNTTVDSSAVPTLASVTAGVPFGPMALWKSTTDVYWGPAPFTASQSYVDARGVVTLINSARYKKQRLVLAMTGGRSTNYTTNGKFDLAKWKNKMNTFNTSAIRNAVAAGVADGTIIGNTLLDEPETKRWGGVMTKPLLDQMASYAKGIFPTLPIGVTHTTNYYKWRTSERYRVVDYVWTPPLSWNTVQNRSSVAAWRDAVLSRSRADGVAVAWGLNPIDGGVRDNDNDGVWECPSTTTEGKGTYYPLCRMTASMVRDWGKTLIASTPGCAFLMWQYEGTYMSRQDNQQAFKDLASILGSSARKSCRRP
jgi:hypothetical protein